MNDHSFSISREASTFVVTVLHGSSMSPAIFDELREVVDTGAGVVVEFGEVKFVNAVFLSVLSQLKKTLDAQGRHLVLRNPPEAILEVLDVVEFHEIDIICDSSH